MKSVSCALNKAPGERCLADERAIIASSRLSARCVKNMTSIRPESNLTPQRRRKQIGVRCCTLHEHAFAPASLRARLFHASRCTAVNVASPAWDLRDEAHPAQRSPKGIES